MSEGMRGPADVEVMLRAREVPYRRIDVAEAARADQAARSLGVDPGAVVKSLLFLADGEPVLVLVGGDRRVDPKRLRQVLKARRVMIAPPERVTQETGYPPGAVPPVGHPRPLPTWIDEGLSAHATVYVSGGAQNVMIALSFSDLSRVTRGRRALIGTPA
ncbi:MAG TPA: YbaK/EbsC family protein [Chloroflexi bacterium]|nr:YbaK/EbsC family protein [Chloroflexota bacterium]